MVVVAIMAIATAGVGLAMRDSTRSQLERDAQRLVALLESARAQSRMTANPVIWRATANGFTFEGLSPAATASQWLDPDVQETGSATLLLGPEPIIGAQQIQLVSVSQPAQRVTIATDGVHPFMVLPDAIKNPATP
jgi:general secretion pathway protein H